jgi:hypothetical protein
VEELLCAWAKKGTRKRNMSRSISVFEEKGHKLRNHQLTTHHYFNPVSQLSFHTRQAGTAPSGQGPEMVNLVVASNSQTG